MRRARYCGLPSSRMSQDTSEGRKFDFLTVRMTASCAQGFVSVMRDSLDPQLHWALDI